jgi:hypothetical protein
MSYVQLTGGTLTIWAEIPSLAASTPACRVERDGFEGFGSGTLLGPEGTGPSSPRFAWGCRFALSARRRRRPVSTDRRFGTGGPDIPGTARGFHAALTGQE